MITNLVVFLLASAPVRFSAAARREQILKVATRIFAQRGFQGATTRSIAEHAGVTEALIFRHFASKEHLYWAVIERKLLAAAGAAQMNETLASGRPDREILAAVAGQILERRAKDQTLSRLLIYSALENHRLAHRFFRNYTAECYERLADFIRERVEQGRFRKVNPVLAARGFFGMVIYHSWMQELYGGKRYQDFSVQEVSESFADLWLQGVVRTPEAEDTSGVPRNSNGNHKNGSHHT